MPDDLVADTLNQAERSSPPVRAAARIPRLPDGFVEVEGTGHGRCRENVWL
jgi:hypothetical protein